MDGSWPLKTSAKKTNDDNTVFAGFDSDEFTGFGDFEAMSLEVADSVLEGVGVYA